VAGDVRLGRKPAGVDDLGKDLAGAKLADPDDVNQRGALLVDEITDLLRFTVEIRS
jgi:hypothetical protein